MSCFGVCFPVLKEGQLYALKMHVAGAKTAW